MKRLILGAMAILLLSVHPVAADLVVNAGNWYLQPNTADQEILINISGGDAVTNAVVMAEIVGSSPLPGFTNGSIVDGTIFESNNSGAPDTAFLSQLAYLSAAAKTDTTVDGDGVLAKLIVSTIGVTSGSFALNLMDTTWGDTFVGTDDPLVGVTYNAGSISIVPEPGMLAMLTGLFALLPILYWRRAKQAI